MDDRSDDHEEEGGVDNLCLPGSTKIHVKALDGIVHVNSLFTFAVFVGLSATDPRDSLIDDVGCMAGQDIADNLVSFHVISFGSFLFSSLIAQGLKQALVLVKCNVSSNVSKTSINKSFFRLAMLLSALGSVCGCIFLMLAIMDVIQIKLGIASCGSVWPVKALVPLFLFVPAGLLVYIFIVSYAFLH